MPNGSSTIRASIHLPRHGGACLMSSPLHETSPAATRQYLPQPVSSCRECNARKGERHAADFLRLLYREGRLTGPELIRGLQLLKDLAAGKLRPALPENGK